MRLDSTRLWVGREDIGPVEPWLGKILPYFRVVGHSYEDQER